MAGTITPNRLAAQMYTLRDLTKTREGLWECLEKIAAIGYGGVQLSAVGAMDSSEVSAEACHAKLDELGLKCVATHRPLERFLENLDEEIALHQTLGCTYTALGYFVHRYENSIEGFRKLIADFTPVAEKLSKHGIQFGIHNHDVEFRRTDGRLHFDVLIEEAPKFMLEIDTFWVVKAGIDCADLLLRCEGRVPKIHVKDLEIAESGARMAPVGEGNLPWNRILAAAEKAGTDTYIVEQDECFRDPFDCLSSSFEFLTSWQPE